MANITKIVQVINLLLHRKSVSVDMICDMCKVSRRTASRYISYISKAGIPVRYDRSLHGFSLPNRNRLDTGSLNIDDAILIAIALALLSKKANGYYKQDTDLLLKRVLSCQGLPLADLWKAFEYRVDLESESKDISDLITTVIIHSAAMFNQKVNVSLDDSSSEIREIEIDSPALCFKDTWRLAARKAEYPNSVSVSQIKRARIV
ncbi:MAG: HTH domain-containing protein [Candidatus Zixiibacteriota bacterium]|nr:MAG: HTH domain-containing protein [candidate division Zixibacteria bacterium]